MPIYSFRDTTNGDVFDLLMSMKDLDEYKQQHPHHERYFDSVPAIVSGVSVKGKMDDGFKDVLSRISEAHPESPLAANHSRKSVKQTQTERALRKWKGSTT